MTRPTETEGHGFLEAETRLGDRVTVGPTPRRTLLCPYRAFITRLSSPTFRRSASLPMAPATLKTWSVTGRSYWKMDVAQSLSPGSYGHVRPRQSWTAKMRRTSVSVRMVPGSSEDAMM
ncbi:hypothetical protein NDU88_011887 [Pleurodeles waltl]|uniref:Uncharacterized protein n=1 Tax=Pleurodeles waltl TaxID=8319 RepID=A0AAV7R2N6_PLEWA|nr:hypothetical protein NDU88_011887 [Pleurodeles waltl]